MVARVTVGTFTTNLALHAGLRLIHGCRKGLAGEFLHQGVFGPGQVQANRFGHTESPIVTGLPIGHLLPSPLAGNGDVISILPWSCYPVRSTGLVPWIAAPDF